MQKKLKNKINDFEELQEITTGDRSKEHKNSMKQQLDMEL